MSGHHAHLQLWSRAITSALPFITGVIYLRGWLALRRAFPCLIGGGRLATFVSGVAGVWIAVGSPLTMLDRQSLTIHMMKHLILMTLVAPLLLAGSPKFPLMCGLPKLFIKIHPALASLPARWLKQHLMHAATCWLAGTAVVIAWHVPAVFQLGLRLPWVHLVEDASFLVAGLLFWWPILESSPNPKKSPQWFMALYLFLATLPCDILSAFLAFCGRTVYPSYLSTTHILRLSALQDQECAGALMWVWITFAYLVPAVVITMRILSSNEIRPRTKVEVVHDTTVAQSMNGAEALQNWLQ